MTGAPTYSVVITAHTSALDGRRSRIVIARDVTAMREAERALQEQVRRDGLTGLAREITADIGAAA